MSRVTIGKLVDDFIDSSIEERDKTRDIEVVPRKIVEDIIGYCKSIPGFGIATYIGDFAGKCLKTFEEGADE